LPLPKFSAASLLGQDCLLCAGASEDRMLCVPCEAALPFLAQRCPRCAIPMSRFEVCGECLARPFAFDDAACRFEYRFPVDRLVQRFKYAGDLAAGRWLALQLAHLAMQAPRPDLVVAAPLSPSRLRERGFNQALELAKVVARSLRVPCDIGGLAKTHETAPQPGLGRRARRANLRGAFRCDIDVAGAHVALVDDVLTTGATADTIARELKRCGAARVSVWAVARTPEGTR
jgi:ComF family protein